DTFPQVTQTRPARDAVKVGKDAAARQRTKFAPFERLRTLDQPANLKPPAIERDVWHRGRVQDGPFTGAGLPRRDAVRAASVRADNHTPANVAGSARTSRLILRVLAA